MRWLSSTGKRSPIVKGIRNDYPLLTQFIDTFNAGTKNKLLIELMKIEGQVINTTLEKIYTDYPDFTVLPVFDAIICSKEIANTVKQELTNNANNFIEHELILKTNINMKEQTLTKHNSNELPDYLLNVINNPPKLKEPYYWFEKNPKWLGGIYHYLDRKGQVLKNIYQYR